MSLPATAFQDITWREGTDRKLRSRFAAVRVRPAHRDYWKAEPYAEEWLLIEWPRGETQPTKYWISTLPLNTKLKALVKMAKHRWIVERDYEELKQELGLGHYEGRVGADFTITPHFASLRMGSWWPSGPVFPPLLASAMLDYPRPNHRRTSARVGRRVRPERHNPSSIATLRRRIARYLLAQLSHCPFCGSPSG